MISWSKAEIRSLHTFLSNLGSAPWLGPARQWWPGRFFHCTDLLNVVSILRTGELLSRQQASSSGRIAVDIASRSVMANTPEPSQDFVRLYFRPRTPTQYRNEGFRPPERWGTDAHCPVPVYLVFDAATLLARSDCGFTEGNLAAGAAIKYTVEEFEKLPFQQIYHDTRFDVSERSTIVFHRNAEVLVPQRVDLNALRIVVCRSQAEYETLLHLLPPGTRATWLPRIGVHHS